MSIIILKTDDKQEAVTKLISNLKIEKGLDAKKYCGKVKLAEDALRYQKKLREEWK